VAGTRYLGIKTLLAIGGLAAGAGAQDLLTPLWCHSSPATGWTPKVVSLGNMGSQAWTQLGPITDTTRLYAAQDDDPGSPAWEHVDALETYTHSVASAETTDVHCTLHDQVLDASANTRSIVLRKYRSSSSAPNWSYTLPFTSNGHDDFVVRVSRDGQRIVVAARNVWLGKTEVLVFGPNSPTPLLTKSLTIGSGFRTAVLASQATKLMVATDTRIAIVDLVTGNVDQTQLLFEQVYNGFAISPDGSAYAYGSVGACKVYRKNAAGTYELRVQDTLPGGVYCDRVAISDDGSTLVSAFNHPDTYLSVTVSCLDLPASLAAGAPVRHMQRTITGSGSLQNLAADIDCTADGSRFAVGLWGDQNGQAPEVQVFSRALSAPTHVFDLQGSVRDLDFSSDGRRLVVASKAQHANSFGGGGRIDLLDTAVGDLRLRGIPRAGGTLDVAVRGNVGSPAALLVATQPLVTPIVFPRLGTYYLVASSVSPVSLGTVAADGYARGSYTIPQGLIGQTLYIQGLVSTPRRLSKDWERFTVLP